MIMRSGQEKMAPTLCFGRLILILSVLLPCVSQQNCKCECCDKLLPGQFYCVDPYIDLYTQSERDCDEDTHTVPVLCYPVEGTVCQANGGEVNLTDQCFNMTRPCRFVRGQRYNLYVAISLSLFLGVFGIDRFYLGYPAIGLLKLCTVGFFFIGYIVDFILIATQTVGPADLSDYYAPYYGPTLTKLRYS